MTTYSYPSVEHGGFATAPIMPPVVLSGNRAASVYRTRVVTAPTPTPSVTLDTLRTLIMPRVGWGGAKVVLGPYRSYIPWWRTDASPTLNGAAFLSIDTSGEFHGSVMMGSTPIEDAMVVLFYRPSMVSIRRARTDAAGSFSFAGLDKLSNDYFAAAFHPDSNARIFDRITPV